MALARIITRSHACSRELAMDLLSRGYAVEIVSPDAIPDNIADLELRVEEEPGNQLVATVAAHNGERSASLEFLHHLKAPMPDFVRRRPESCEANPQADPPSRDDAELSMEKGESPLEAFPVTTKAIAPVTETDSGFEQEARPIPTPVKQTQVEVPGYFAVEEPHVAPSIVESAITDRLPEAESTRPTLSQSRPAGWFWRTALTSSAVIVVALLFAFGMRRNGQESGRSTEMVPLEKTASSVDATFEGVADTGKDSAKDSKQVVVSAISPTLHSEASSGQAIKQIPVAKSAPAAEKARAKTSRHHEDDFVARDTITYLDKRFESNASSKPVKKTQTAQRAFHRRRNPRHRGEVIAANKLTYLDKQAPKATK